jgi:outer membrane lipoprotein-sorting protein
MGGADKIAAVKDVIHTMEIALEASAGGFKMKQVSRYVAPGQIRHEQETPFGKITVYSDGKSGWLGTPQGIQAIPPDVLKLAKGVIFRQPTVLVLSDQDISRSVNAVGDNEVKISTSDGQSVLMQFDPVTGLPSRQVYIESDVNRGSVERVELLSDWRDAGGIKMPYRAVQQENGVKTLEVTISEYRFNSGITSDDLSQKPTN